RRPAVRTRFPYTTLFRSQAIGLDDQRFIGPSGWRQDEQTFDAVRGDSRLGKLALTGVWIGQVNRVFAEELDWDSDSWIVRASYRSEEHTSELQSRENLVC